MAFPAVDQGQARQAFWISVVINVLMILLGIIRPSHVVSSFLARISDVLAAPPGVFINQIVHSTGHNVRALLLAIGESIIVSLLFYFICVWVVLFFVDAVRARMN